MRSTTPSKFAIRLFRRSTGSYLQLVGSWDTTTDLKRFVYQKYPGWEIDQIAAVEK